jgi:predicted dehydrogenase
MNRISRRRFAAAVAAPMIVPASVFGSASKLPPGERLGLGIIGTGTMGYSHLRAFQNEKDVQITAISDVDIKRREFCTRTLAEGTGKEGSATAGVPTFNDYRELLARTDVDAVLIAVPDHWHAAAAIDALKAGKDVYCEKPLTLTLHEGKALIEAVRKTQRVFQVGSQQRSDKEFWTACSAVRSGRIGKITQVKVKVGLSSKWCDLPEEKPQEGLDWDRWLGQAPARPYHPVLAPRGMHSHFPKWREYREYSGGYYTDWGAHHFDIAQWGLGMDESGPVEIIPPEDPKAFTGCRYRYAGGVEMIHDGPDGVTFIGTEGEIFVNRGRLTSTKEAAIQEPFGDKEVRLYRSPGHRRDWLEAIKSRRRPICDVEVGARSVAVCHLGNLAYWNRRPLKWDPVKWEFVGDAEANGWRDRPRREKYPLPTV